jgi:curved DNA-binding protein CbpA
MAIQAQETKRTFYQVLQVSDDADVDAIAASYLRLKLRYRGSNDAAARNELIFIEHAYQTLSDRDRRRAYDLQVAGAAKPVTHYTYHRHSDEGWFTSSKLLVVMIGLLAMVAYGLKTAHTKELTDGSVQSSRVIEQSADTAQTNTDARQPEGHEERCRDAHLLVAQADSTAPHTEAQPAQTKICN